MEKQISCTWLLQGVTQSSFLSVMEWVQAQTREALFDLTAYGMIILRYLSSSTPRKHFKEGTRGGWGSCQFRLECYQWLARSLYCRYCMEEEIADGVTEASYIMPCVLSARGALLGIITWVQMIKKNNTFCLIQCLTGTLGRLYWKGDEFTLVHSTSVIVSCWNCEAELKVLCRGAFRILMEYQNYKLTRNTRNTRKRKKGLNM